MACLEAGGAAAIDRAIALVYVKRESAEVGRHVRADGAGAEIVGFAG